MTFDSKLPFLMNETTDIGSRKIKYNFEHPRVVLWSNERNKKSYKKNTSRSVYVQVTKHNLTLSLTVTRFELDTIAQIPYTYFVHICVHRYFIEEKQMCVCNDAKKCEHTHSRIHVYIDIYIEVLKSVVRTVVHKTDWHSTATRPWMKDECL